MPPLRFIFARTAAGSFSAIVFTCAVTGHTASDHSPIVNGTGGSSATRVLAQWSLAFAKESGINVVFAPANSGVGIVEAIARHVDFGCTEIPLSAEDQTKNALVQFPLLVGGVVVVVNIPGVAPVMLRLNSNLVSRIYSDELKFWNAEAIRAVNPGVSLPSLPIKLIVRETAASTTLALTTFLTATDGAWASRMGANALPKWPAPTLQAATVLAIGELVKSTPGAVGYINFDEAYRNKLAYAQLHNYAGQFVKPSQESILAASKGAGLGRTGERIPVLINVDGE